MDDRASEYAGGDAAFAAWLADVDRIVSGQLGLSVFDLEDMMFRDEFDAGTSPHEFVVDVVAELLREEYGDEYADLVSVRQILGR